jgi:hypothetical protein
MEFAVGDGDFAAGGRGDVFIRHSSIFKKAASQIIVNGRKSSGMRGSKESLDKSGSGVPPLFTTCFFWTLHCHYAIL